MGALLGCLAVAAERVDAEADVETPTAEVAVSNSIDTPTTEAAVNSSLRMVRIPGDYSTGQLLVMRSPGGQIVHVQPPEGVKHGGAIWFDTAVSQNKATFSDE